MEREVLGSCLGMKLGVIVGRDSNSSVSSGGKKGSVDCRLDEYLGIKSAGSSYQSRWD